MTGGFGRRTGTDLSKGWVFTQSVLKADDFSEKSEAGWARVEPRIESSFSQVELQALSFLEILPLKPGWGHKERSCETG